MVESASKELWQAIASANETFIGYFRDGNAAGIASLYAEDGQAQPANSDVITGREAIQKFWQGAMNMGLKSGKLTTVELVGTGDLLCEMGRYALAVEGGQVVDEGKYVVIWKKEGGQWQLWRDIWNTSRPAPS